MYLTKISVLNDNYVWIIHNNFDCIIVDPGEFKKIIKKIENKKWKLIAIFLTHHHPDHIGGVLDIKKKYPNIKIFGSRKIKKYGIKNIFFKKKIFLLNKIFYMFKIPGHTDDHVLFYSKPYIFCGDTIFSGGCGRVENNKYLDLYHSIKKILCFPDNSFLCYAHEYTLSNLNFSLSIVPNDIEINQYYKKVKEGLFLCPSTIFFEKKINLFLRFNEVCVKKAIGLNSFTSSFKTFLRLRLIKDFY